MPLSRNATAGMTQFHQIPAARRRKSLYQREKIIAPVKCITLAAIILR
jgi:hypothetical protein